MASNSKGQAIELSTFRKYCKDEVIGSKTEKSNGKTVMVSIWCKNFDPSNSSDSDSSSEFKMDIDELQQ